MAMWDVDLTTRMGAQTATGMGSYAAFAFGLLGVLGVLVYGLGHVGATTAESVGAMIGGAFEAGVGLIAGLRLRAGKGFVWGIVAAVFAALELLGKILAIQITGVVLCAIILVYLINGVRGARVLKQDRFAEDEADVFG